VKLHWIFCAAMLLPMANPADAKERANCRLMQRLAQQHSNDMARRDAMDHAGFYDRARQGARAENVAMGSSTRACVEYASTRMQGRCIGRIPVWQALLDDGDRTIERPDRLTTSRASIA
jgi:hypothetical protein